MNTPHSASSTAYVGRFAPSPTGDLHFGSLVAALGSYLHAKAHQGRWCVRIEDIDPPREVPGAAQRILKTLERFGLTWDGEVVWQSRRHRAYQEALETLKQRQCIYACHCSRQRIHDIGGIYDGHCREINHHSTQTAIRLRQTRPVYQFDDLLLGTLQADPVLAQEDFILRRRDQLFAYNLAVVIDDHFQGVTHIVRGADLIQPTVRQISLYQHLHLPVPHYLHLPLACTHCGDKLSKQNHAPALPEGDPRAILAQALVFLGQPLPECWQDLTHCELLTWAIAHWSVTQIPHYCADAPQELTSPFSKSQG
jgi:glutamyl-Q tRNA(Asp) synthetase